MKYRIKESKNIFPCTVYMKNQDYDEAYYYLDTPEYGLSWRSFDDVEQEDVENYKYIIKNTADLRKAIDDLEEDFIYGYGTKYFKLSGNYMEDLLNRGKTLVHVSNIDSRDTVFIIKVKPAQNVELALAESFEKTIKNLQKEGLFENVSSFDLNFNGKGINIKLNEGYPAYRKDSPKVRGHNDARKKKLNSIEKNAKRDAAHRYESFKRASNLRENESDESKYPFTDLILFSINRYHDVRDFWPTLRSVSENAFYDEVSEQTGMDYDDVKDYCWDMVPNTPTIEEIFNELVYMGSEKYLSEKYGTLENLQKVIDKDDADTEAEYEEFANRFDSLFDGELENEYKEAVNYAVADLEARFNR